MRGVLFVWYGFSFFFVLFLLPKPSGLLPPLLPLSFFSSLFFFFLIFVLAFPLCHWSIADLSFSSNRNATAISSTGGTSSAASPRIPSVYGVRSGG